MAIKKSRYITNHFQTKLFEDTSVESNVNKLHLTTRLLDKYNSEYRHTIDFLSQVLSRKVDRDIQWVSPQDKTKNYLTEIFKSYKSEEEEENDLSNLQITRDGFISDRWDKIENIESRIIEITESNIVLECLVDYVEKKFQNRTFPKSLIDGIPFKIYQPVLIKIFTRKNELKFLFVDGGGLVDISKFEVEYFEKIPFEFFNKKI